MKKVFLLIVLVLFLIAIPATVYLVAQRQELRQKAAPATTLSFTPSTVSRKVGDEFSLNVQIDTAENQVVAAEIHLTFDSNYLEAETITNGALFPNVLASGVVEPGTASITVGAESATSPVKGSGTAAIVTFRALKSTTSPTSVRFDPTTFAGALGEGATNILIGTTPATITIIGTSVVPSPTSALPATTPQPTSSISPQITMTPTPTGTASPSGETQEDALEITSPVPNTQVAEMPVIRGKAAPGSTVTVTIYSEPVTAVVTADANGNWSYTPPAPLTSGPHSVVASAQDPTTGTTQSTTAAFVVAGGNEAATESGTPTAGSALPTMLLTVMGTLLLLGGTALWTFGTEKR